MAENTPKQDLNHTEQVNGENPSVSKHEETCENQNKKSSETKKDDTLEEKMQKGEDREQIILESSEGPKDIQIDIVEPKEEKKPKEQKREDKDKNEVTLTTTENSTTSEIKIDDSSKKETEAKDFTETSEKAETKEKTPKRETHDLTFIEKLICQFFYFYGYFICGATYSVAGSILQDLASITNSTDTSIVLLTRAIGLILGGLITPIICQFTFKLNLRKRAFKKEFEEEDENGKKKKGMNFFNGIQMFFLSFNIHHVIFTAAMMILVAFYFTPIAENLYIQAILFFFMGAGFQSLMVSCQLGIELTWHHSKASIRTGFFATASFLFGFSAFAAPLICGLVFSFEFEPKKNLTIIFWGMLIIFCFACFIVLIKPPPSIEHQDGEEDDENINPHEKDQHMESLTSKDVKFIEHEIAEFEEKTLHLKEHKKEKPPLLIHIFDQFSIIMKEICKKFNFLRLIFLLIGAFAFFVYIGLGATFGGSFFTFAYKSGFSKDWASYLSSIYFLMYAFGRLFGVFISFLFKQSYILIVDAFILLVFLLFFLFFSYSHVMIWICVLIGFFYSRGYTSILYNGILFGITKLSPLENGILLFGSSVGYAYPFFVNELMDWKKEAYIYVCLGSLIIQISLIFIQNIIGIIYHSLYVRNKQLHLNQKIIFIDLFFKKIKPTDQEEKKNEELIVQQVMEDSKNIDNFKEEEEAEKEEKKEEEKKGKEVVQPKPELPKEQTVKVDG